MTTTLTPNTFATEVLNSTTPVLVDFWAPWCGPCRVMNPIIEAIAHDYDGTIKVAKLNVDDAPEIASQYQITAIPTLLLFHNGEVIEHFQGLVSQDSLVARLAAHGFQAAIAA
ncbi:MAG: thioredoxin [Spirulina sp. SIO3F2]|nr:thioredoxin [Spirulina sp. SIO3F2]